MMLPRRLSVLLPTHIRETRRLPAQVDRFSASPPTTLAGKRHVSGSTLVALCAALQSLAGVTGCVRPDPDISAKLWDVETSAQLQVFRAGGTVSYTAAFSPDGTKLLIGYPHSPILCDIKTGARLQTLVPLTSCPSVGDSGNSQSMVAFSPDGTKALASNWGGATLWNLKTGREIWAYCKHDQAKTTLVAFSPDGRRVLVARGYLGSVWLDAATGKEIKSLDVPLIAGALSSDGRMLLCGGQVMGTPPSPRRGTTAGTATLFDAETGTELRTFWGHTTGKAIGSVAFSGDGSRILTGSNDGTATIWDTYTGEAIRTFRTSDGSASIAAISPDATRVLTTGFEGNKIRLWDAGSGDLIRIYPTGSGARGFVFSPDGATFVALGYGRWHGH